MLRVPLHGQEFHLLISDCGRINSSQADLLPPGKAEHSGNANSAYYLVCVSLRVHFCVCKHMWTACWALSPPYVLSQGLSLDLELVDLSTLDGKETAWVYLSLPD